MRINKISSGQLTPPHGLQGIIETFGDISSGVNSDGRLSQRWQDKHLSRFKLPWSIPLSWNPDLVTNNIYCHKEIGEIIQELLESIERCGLRRHIHTFGGCFFFRHTRSGTKLSTHSWGIAIDLNVATNQMGTTGDMDPRLVQLFREYGFKWGGDWPGRSKDPMHFQFCTGY